MPTEAKKLQYSSQNDRDPCMSNCLTLCELKDAISKLKQKKAPGPDRVTNEMLKHLGQGTKQNPPCNLQSELVQWLSTIEVEGSPYATNPQRVQRQKASRKLQTH